MRGHLAEFGIITAQGPHKVLTLIRAIQTGEVPGLPQIAGDALESLVTQLDNLAGEIRKLERRLMLWHRQDETSQRLETIPGVGIITATALAASVPDPAVFKTGRQLAAFLGLVPRQNSSGDKERLGRISKMGDGYLRRLLVVGATSVIRRADSNTSAIGTWVRGQLERKPARVVTVAMANKTARIGSARCSRPRSESAASNSRYSTWRRHLDEVFVKIIGKPTISGARLIMWLTMVFDGRWSWASQWLKELVRGRSCPRP